MSSNFWLLPIFFSPQSIVLSPQSRKGDYSNAIARYELKTWDCGLRTVDSQLLTVNCGLWTDKLPLPTRGASHRAARVVRSRFQKPLRPDAATCPGRWTHGNRRLWPL